MKLLPHMFEEEAHPSMTGEPRTYFRLSFSKLPAREQTDLGFYSFLTTRTIVYGNQRWFNNYCSRQTALEYSVGEQEPAYDPAKLQSYWFQPSSLIVRQSSPLGWVTDVSHKIVRCCLNPVTHTISSVLLNPHDVQYYCPDLYQKFKHSLRTDSYGNSYLAAEATSYAESLALMDEAIKKGARREPPKRK